MRCKLASISRMKEERRKFSWHNLFWILLKSQNKARSVVWACWSLGHCWIGCTGFWWHVWLTECVAHMPHAVTNVVGRYTRETCRSSGLQNLAKLNDTGHGVLTKREARQCRPRWWYSKKIHKISCGEPPYIPKTYGRINWRNENHKYKSNMYVYSLWTWTFERWPRCLPSDIPIKIV